MKVALTQKSTCYVSVQMISTNTPHHHTGVSYNWEKVDCEWWCFYCLHHILVPPKYQPIYWIVKFIILLFWIQLNNLSPLVLGQRIKNGCYFINNLRLIHVICLLHQLCSHTYMYSNNILALAEKQLLIVFYNESLVSTIFSWCLGTNRFCYE